MSAGPGIWLLTAVAMAAFAGNSLLNRLALTTTAIDAASYTAIRIVAGAAALALIVLLRRDRSRPIGSWGSALALLAYAAPFSYAYGVVTAATGTLLLFGAVQATMIGHGWWRGERLALGQWAGLACAGTGLGALLAPGLAAPPWDGALLMLVAGLAWGVYSLRGRGSGDPTCVTAGNFLRAVPLALALLAAALPWMRWDGLGAVYAAASGALTSGIGYAIWYLALRGLTATRAAVVQLSVPVLVALGGVALLDEPLSLRLILAALAILGGIALVIIVRRPAAG